MTPQYRQAPKSKKSLYILVYFVWLLQLSCVPEETDFLSPIPIAHEASEINYTSFIANWSSTLGVESYILEVATDFKFNNKLPAFPLEVNNNQKVIEGLADGMTYYFRVRGIFNGSNTKYSNVIAVTTTSYRSLFPDNLRLIENGVTQFMVQWDRVAEADGYMVNVALDEDFTSPVSNYFQVDVGDEDTITFFNLLPDQNYYCKVQSYSEGTGGSGKVFSDDSDILLVRTLPVPPPALNDPQDINPLSFTAIWEPVEHATLYLLDVSEDINFNTILPEYHQKAVLDTKALVTDLDYRKNYFYRVKAVISDIESEYSTIQVVNSSISSSCKISKVYYLSDRPTVFHYNTQGLLTGMDVIPRSGSSANYRFTYDTSGNISEALSTNVFGDTLNTTTFFYTSNGDIDSLGIEWGNRVEEIKYTYNSESQLIHYLSTETYHSSPNTTYLIMEHNYTYDVKGNINTIVGREYYFGFRDINWELRYDDKINPFVLLPNAIARFIPFTISVGSVSYVPFLPERNITYIDFTTSTEIVAYDYNQLEMATKQLGFFKVDYEFEGCN